MNGDFTRINITFNLPADIAEQLAVLSKKLSDKEETAFVLDNENFFPHITIYSLEYPSRNENKILETVEKLAESFSPIKFIPIGMQTEGGYLGVEFEYSEEIRKIHETMVESLNVFREDHLREKYTEENLSGLPLEKRQNIQKYGQANLLNLYIPHVTITKLMDKKIAERMVKEMKIPFEEFVSNEIRAYKMGKNGTCVELVKEFILE